MTAIRFVYDAEKDAENFIKGASSVNNKKPTKLQELYMEKHGADFNPSKVLAFLEERNVAEGFDFAEIAKTMERNWGGIGKKFMSRVESIFKVTLPQPVVTAYLSTNSRCTYNIPGGYFFVYVGAESPNSYLMHELLHFYTWYAIHPIYEERGLSEGDYNDMKESLTQLLNEEFADLMDGSEDLGYPQHKALRQRIRAVWPDKKDVRALVETLLKVCKDLTN